MAKKIVTSKYIGVDYEIEVEEIEVEAGRVISNITHESLERIIFNEIPEEYGVKVSVPEPININVPHPVILRTISDNKGRCIRKLGEASPNTLTTQIAKDYPVTMADTRAFDRAAIAYLNFDLGDTHVYSSSEGIEVNNKNTPSDEEFKTIMSNIAATKEAATTAPVTSQTVNAEPTPEPTPVSDPEPPKQEEKEEVPDDFMAFVSAADEATLGQENSEPIYEPVPEFSSDNISDPSHYGDVMIAIGKHVKDPKSVKWLVENDMGWVSYMTQNYIPTTDDKQAQMDALKNYISENGIQIE